MQLEINSKLPQALLDELFFKKAQVYLVGGVVRDAFLGLDSKDQDHLITDIEFDALIKILKKFGVVNLVGKSFGVIKFKPFDQTNVLDIALPRTEISTGKKHTDFKVDFDPSLDVKDDLLRRDFTINAMAYDVRQKKLIDPFGGQKDLSKKVLRIVFEKAFLEDPLRILRAVQFSARFDLTIDPHTFQLMQKEVLRIADLSKERIVTEIQKIFLAPKPSVGFYLLDKLNALPMVFDFLEPMKKIKQPNKENETVFEHTLKVLDQTIAAKELQNPGDLDLMFAALFHDAGKPKTCQTNEQTQRTHFHNHELVSQGIAKRWLHDFKAQNIGVDIKKVRHLVKNHMFDAKPLVSEKPIRRFIKKIGPQDVLDLIDLRIADKKAGRFPKKNFQILELRKKIIEELEKKTPFTIKDLKIDGHDLCELGLEPGPEFGEIFSFLLKEVVDDPQKNQKEVLLKLVNDFLSKKKGSLLSN